MALNETHFEYADRGSTSVFKFQVEADPTIFVWFEYGDGKGSLHTTREMGPYRVEHGLVPAAYPTLDALLEARGSSKEQWVRDLMAQFGERLAWTYP
ncbi:MAG: hypothetical protein ACYSX0_10825 [Planctomycetota bacterium]|jgi:hypothetical protein